MNLHKRRMVPGMGLVACTGLLVAGALWAGPRTHVAGERPKIWREADREKAASAEQAARADARRRMLERIYGLEVSGSTSVHDLVKMNKAVEAPVHSALQGMREKAWRYYDDGSCQVAMEVRWREVVERVGKEISKATIEGQPVDAREFVRRNTENRDRTLCVWGSGSIAGSEGVATVQTQRAAAPDAHQEPARPLTGMKVGSRTSVRNMVRAPDKVVAAASRNGVDFTGCRVKPKVGGPDPELAAETVIRRIERTYQKSSRNGGRPEKIEEVYFEKGSWRRDTGASQDTGKSVRLFQMKETRTVARTPLASFEASTRRDTPAKPREVAVPTVARVEPPSSAPARQVRTLRQGPAFRLVDKQCSRCGKSVPLTSRAGRCCPHCGAYWSFEQSIHVNKWP